MSRLKVLYFDKKNIKYCHWPETIDAQYAKNYLLPLILNGTKKFITNIQADVSIIILNDKVIPIVLSSPKAKNCYVCNPYAQYITYAMYELKELKTPILEWFLAQVIGALGFILKLCHFNKVVTVNNWLLSTNLYPPLSKEEIKAINHKMSELFPEHIILYRSLNEYTNKDLLKVMQELSGKRIISRQVYITDPHHPQYKERSDYKKDRTFLAKTPLIIESQINELDLPEIKQCYDALYLEKYSDLNPQFTLRFFANALKHNLFTFKAVKDNKRIIAALGYFSRNNVMTTPIFGFDQRAPVQWGLYRLISSQLMQESEANKCILNQSSGAAHFKAQRGAIPFIEYNIFFRNSAMIKQWVAWLLMGTLLNIFGTYLLRRFKL